MVNRKNAFVLLFFLLVCVSLLAAPVKAPVPLVIVTPPVKDTEIDGGWVDLNMGADGMMNIGEGAPGVWRVLVQFDLPAEISGKTIVSAVLKLHTLAPWTDPPTANPAGLLLNACRITHDWVEGDGYQYNAPGTYGATWNEYGKTAPGGSMNNWTTPGGDFTSVDSATTIWPVEVSDGWANFTVTKIVQGWAINSYANYGFLIKLDIEDAALTKGGAFVTKENTPLQASILEITYGPDFVIPEVPWGTLTASIAAITALFAFAVMPRIRKRI